MTLFQRIYEPDKLPKQNLQENIGEMSSTSKKIETMNLWMAPSHIWLEATDKSLPVVSISRETVPRISLTEQRCIPNHAFRRSIQGVLGILEFPLSIALLVVGQKRKVGDLEGAAIYRLESVEVISISSKNASSSDELEAHRRCQILTQDAVSTPYYYFSYSTDLTHSRQRLWHKEDIWEQSDSRFLWNFQMGQSFLKLSDDTSRNSLSKFLIKLIHGAVFIHRCTINGVRRNQLIRTKIKWYITSA